MHCFSEWFMNTVIPHTRKLSGKKVLISDNLSSHLSEEVIDSCEKNNIAFVFLSANSTHLCQPLDVSFFRPMKIAWRKIVEKWKKGPGRRQATIPKDTFPQLLRSLTDAITTNAKSNLKSGFEACGIFPLNPSKVTNKLPDASCTVEDSTAACTKTTSRASNGSIRSCTDTGHRWPKESVRTSSEIELQCREKQLPVSVSEPVLQLMTALHHCCIR